MMARSLSFLVAIGLFAAGMSGCGGGGGGVASSLASTQRITVTVQFPVARNRAHDTIASAWLTVTGDDMSPIVQPMSYDSSTFSATTTVTVPVGTHRTFRVDAKTAADLIVYTGESSGVQVVAGETVQVAITMATSTGTASVVVKQVLVRTDSFDSEITGAHPGNWTVSEINSPATSISTNDTVFYSDTGSASGKSIEFIDTQNADFSSMTGSTHDAWEKVAFEWAQKADDITGHLECVFIGPEGEAGSIAFSPETLSGRVVLTTTGNSVVDMAQWEAGAWYTVRVELDTDADTYSKVYLQGILVATNIALRTPVRSITGVTFRTGDTTSSPEGTARYVDNFKEFALTDQTATVPMQREWTVMVFMNADDDGSNSLESWAIDDINEMELVGSTDSVTILVQIDRVATGNDSSNGDWTDTRRYLVDYDPTFTPSQTLNGMGSGDRTIRSTRLDDQPEPLGNGVGLGELNMGAWETLRDFIEYGKSNYPAPHYAVVIWDHGSGIKDWGKSVARSLSRGVSFDDTDLEYIATHELDDALATSALIPVPLDIVAFDASLMQMVAVAHQIRSHTELVVASEESPPGEGFPYHRWLGELVDNPFMTSARLATAICQEAVAEVGGKGGASTQSALRTSELNNLEQKVNDLASYLYGYLRVSYASELGQARDEAKSYADTEFKDLYHYAELVKTLVNNTNAQSYATEVQNAIQAAVLVNETANVSNSNGVSIWIPDPSPDLTLYSDNMVSYNKTDFGNSSWVTWILNQQE